MTGSGLDQTIRNHGQHATPPICLIIAFPLRSTSRSHPHCTLLALSALSMDPWKLISQFYTGHVWDR